MTIRVLVADDQPLMRTAFDMTLQPEPDIELVGEAADGLQAIDLARRHHPDVVLMDIRMPVLDGVEATRVLVQEEPAIKVVVLTTFDLDEYIVEALRAGASGYLLKDVMPEDLVQAIRIVARGDAFLAPSVTRRLLDSVGRSIPSIHPKRGDVLEALTATEIKVLTLVGRGLANEEIAQELFVAETTIRTHIRHILDKLSLRDRIQAVVLAYDSGLVEAAR